MMLGDAKAVYLMPIAPAGARGGPDFMDGAFDQENCYTDTIPVSGAGKMPLIPPTSSLPADVREIKSWSVGHYDGHTWSGTAVVTRCGRRRACLEALYDRDTTTWYCSSMGDPCGEAGLPACTRVPDDAR